MKPHAIVVVTDRCHIPPPAWEGDKNHSKAVKILPQENTLLFLQTSHFQVNMPPEQSIAGGGRTEQSIVPGGVGGAAEQSITPDLSIVTWLFLAYRLDQQDCVALWGTERFGQILLQTESGGQESVLSGKVAGQTWWIYNPRSQVKHGGSTTQGRRSNMVDLQPKVAGQTWWIYNPRSNRDL
uniref:Uncharacterized protein n=1 Tax=Branchiostoma floridae TaxID=7739 RepID=C3ZZG2_BRAFL|eukprot:XP_002586060.1 hypothetical protein BRAFLDRAFT_107292 [Branchiostoma floridae]